MNYITCDFLVVDLGGVYSKESFLLVLPEEGLWSIYAGGHFRQGSMYVKCIGFFPFWPFLVHFDRGSIYTSGQFSRFYCSCKLFLDIPYIFAIKPRFFVENSGSFLLYCYVFEIIAFYFEYRNFHVETLRESHRLRSSYWSFGYNDRNFSIHRNISSKS